MGASFMGKIRRNCWRRWIRLASNWSSESRRVVLLVFVGDFQRMIPNMRRSVGKASTTH
jgi:hypothetical protein